jgi:PAS domain S-box-containing protein
MTEFSRDKEKESLYAGRSAFPEAEEQLRLLINNLQNYAIFSLDTQGRISSWNAGAERIHGYPAHEVIDKQFSIFFPQEDLPRGMNERVRQLGGELKLSSSQKGMTVRATIPIATSGTSAQRPD